MIKRMTPEDISKSYFAANSEFAKRVHFLKVFLSVLEYEKGWSWKGDLTLEEAIDSLSYQHEAIWQAEEGLTFSQMEKLTKLLKLAESKVQSRFSVTLEYDYRNGYITK